MKINKGTVIKYVSATVLGLLLGAAVLFGRSDANFADKNELIKYLSDAFFVPAMLYICFGLMMLAVNAGTLDIIGYGFKSLVYLFTPMKKDRQAGGYYEYKVAKAQKRKPTPYYIIFVGLAFLIPSIILAVMYN